MKSLASLIPKVTPKSEVYTFECQNCGEHFTTKKKDKLYCSTECKKEFNKPSVRQRQKDGYYYLPAEYTTPNFVSVDGEAIKEGAFTRNWIDSDGNPQQETVIKSHYVMLQADGIPPLFAPCLLDDAEPVDSLSTMSILEWFLDEQFKGKTIIGYFLNYDFENWLKDVPNDLYLQLLEAKEIEWNGYYLWMIPKKIFRIRVGAPNPEKVTSYNPQGLENMRERCIYDYSGYWQRAFLKTVQDNRDCCTDYEWQLLVEGKGARNTFKKSDWKAIAEYNQTECTVLTKIARKSFDSIAEGFKHSNIQIKPKGSDSYSPKCLATKFFKLLKWTEKHPILSLPDHAIPHFTEQLGDYFDEKLLKFPFACAYFGGRIESLVMGEIQGEVFAYDIRSAYPKGLSKMPVWNADDLIYDTENPTHYADKRYAGMFLIEWNLPSDWALYPFPYRNEYSNVFFPSTGRGWISSLEFYSALDTIPKKEWHTCIIEACAVIRGTENQGGIDYSSSGDEWENAYNARQDLKRAGISGEYGVKLLLNAGYGGTIQQVGVKDWKDTSTLKVFNDFVGMWITAYCRATAWRECAVYRKEKGTIIAIQTDGVYSTKPLHKAPLDARLGCWEKEVTTNFINIMAGIYRYKKGNKEVMRQRGWGKAFSFDKAVESLYSGEVYSVEQDTFIPRGFALHQKNVLAGCERQWIKTVKFFEPSLASKRDCPKRVRLKTPNKYYKPKINTGFVLLCDETISKPFKLKFTNDNHLDNLSNPEFLSEHVEGNENYYAGIQE